MGKIKPVKARRKQRQAINSPIGKVTDTEITEAKRQQIGILSKIDSETEEERRWAIGSVARLIMEEPKTFHLVVENSDVIARLVKRIFDPQISVRISAAGVIRNLTAIGDAKVCEKIVDADCLSSFVALLKELKEEEQIIEKSEIEELVLNSMCALANMSELSEYVIEKILSSDILPKIFQLLRPSVGTVAISIASAELLVVLSEDYEPIKKYITNDHVMLLKISLANQKHNICLRSLATTILYNIYPKKEFNGLIKVAMPTLRQSLEFDGNNLFLTLASSSPEEYPLKHLLAGAMTKDISQKLEEWKNCARSQITCLEILTNFLVEDDEEETEEMMEINDVLAVPEEVLLEYQKANILQMIVTKCVFVPEVIQNLGKIDSLKDYIPLLNDVQARALSCLTNIILCFPKEALGDIMNLWNVIFQLCTVAFSVPTNPEIQIIIINILYGIARRGVIIPEKWQVEAIFKLTLHSEEHVRSSCIGLLGCISKTPIGPHVINDIGQALIKGMEDPSGWVIVEALDVVFSVFDDQYDETFRKLNFLQKLQQFLPYLNRRIKEGKDDALLLDKLDEARINIPHFIKYKKEQYK